MTAPVSPSAPVAWRMVPVEPTEAMLDDACESGPDTPAGRFDYSDARSVWEAMLAASPAPSMVGLREKVARAICYWSEPSTCHDAYCCGQCVAVKPDDWCWKAADQCLALLAREGK